MDVVPEKISLHVFSFSLTQCSDLSQFGRYRSREQRLENEETAEQTKLTDFRRYCAHKVVHLQIQKTWLERQETLVALEHGSLFCHE